MVFVRKSCSQGTSDDLTSTSGVSITHLMGLLSHAPLFYWGMGLPHSLSLAWEGLVLLMVVLLMVVAPLFELQFSISLNKLTVKNYLLAAI